MRIRAEIGQPRFERTFLFVRSRPAGKSHFPRLFTSGPVKFDHRLINGLSDTPALSEVPKLSRLINGFGPWLFLKRLFVGGFVLWKTRHNFKSLTIDTSRLEKNIKGPVIFVANHRSDIDPPLLGAVMLRHVGFPWFMAKKELWKSAFHRLIYALGASLPIDRHSTDIKSVRPFVSLLKAGKPLVIFLEGFRPHAVDLDKDLEHNLLYSDIDPQTGLLPGKSIALTLALASGAKIVPVAINGLSLHRDGPFLLGLGPARNPKTIDLKVTFGPTIDICDFVAQRTAGKNYQVRKADMEAATHLVMAKISEIMDFGLEYFPNQVPVPECAMAEMREKEEQQAIDLEKVGKSELAAIIRARHALHLKKA